MRSIRAPRAFYGLVVAFVFVVALACSQFIGATSAYAADKVYDSYYNTTVKKGQYTYKFYALNDAQTTLYNKPYSEQVLYYNHAIPLYLKTDNPDASSFEVRSSTGRTMTMLTADTNQFSDIDFKADASGKMCKVDGGYIFTFYELDPGTYSYNVVEKNADGSVVFADRFEVTVADYDEAQNDWVDSVISKATASDMDSFEKMDAVIDYLSSHYDFKYLTFDSNAYNYVYQASEPNLPFFKTERWDSLVSPTKLKLFADRIGGFSEVINMYYEYDRGTAEWSQWHSYINCVQGSENKYYSVCPLSNTGAVDVTKKIDFTNPNSLHEIQGIRSFTYATDPGTSGSGGNAGSVNQGSGTSTDPIAVTGTWKKTGGKWWYSYSNASATAAGKPCPVNDWVKIDGTTYHFDSRGYMNTGWASIGGSWYYFASSGAMKTGWVKSGKTWYYLNSDGKMATGWKNVSGVWYYLKPTNGAMAKGWLQDSGNWYYLKASGAMAKGWQKVGSKWYYLNDSGVMVNDGFQGIGGKYYHFTASGAMSIGWKNIDGSWYYFASSGAAKQNQWLKSGGKWYYFASDYRMCTGFRDIGGKTYYLNASGAMATGWKQIDGNWRYFSSSGVMQMNKWVGGKYWLNDKGIMATDQWVDGGKYYVDTNGVWVPGKRSAA